MKRDIAKRLKYEKPACIHNKFFPSIKGMTGKMSASDTASTIYLNDTPKQIKKKINWAVSGGGDSLQEHQENGTDFKKDIPYQVLQFFLEDDLELARIGEEYSSWRMSTAEVKNIWAESVIQFFKDYQENRKKVTDEDVELFCKVRPIYPASSKIQQPCDEES